MVSAAPLAVMCVLSAPPGICGATTRTALAAINAVIRPYGVVQMKRAVSKTPSLRPYAVAPHKQPRAPPRYRLWTFRCSRFANRSVDLCHAVAEAQTGCNETLEMAHAVAASVAESAQTLFDDNERWQDGETGNQVGTWIDYSELSLDEVDLDLPEPLEELDREIRQMLRQQQEPSRSGLGLERYTREPPRVSLAVVEAVPGSSRVSRRG
jgi:hypothetical protein